MARQRIGNPFGLHHINRALRRRLISLLMPQNPRTIPMRRRSPEVRATTQGLTTPVSSTGTTDQSTTSSELHESSSPNQLEMHSADTSNALANILEDRPPLAMWNAVYPQFSLIPQRRATFTSWPRSQHFPPEDLVMQGFYFAGYADCVRCFYCGVGLKSWADDDDVMKEHIRWRPTCGYVLHIRGKQFVDQVLEDLRREHTGEGDSSSRGTINRQADLHYANANSVVPTATSSSSNATQQHRLHTDGPETTAGEDAEHLQRVREENERLRALHRCKICKEQEVGVIFLPCGHLIACVQCASRTRNCTLCGAYIRATVNAYLG